VALFALSLLAGTMLASTAVRGALSWWNERPPTLTAIAVLGNERLSSSEVAKATGLTLGGGTDDISETELETRVALHPWVRSARVVVLPTGTLIVEIEEREPRAVLCDADCASQTSPSRFVDSGGVPFADSSEHPLASQLPALRSAAPRPAGLEDAELAEALGLAERLAPLELAGLASTGDAHRGIVLRLPDDDRERGWVLEQRRDGGTKVLLGTGSASEVAPLLGRLEQLLAARLTPVGNATTIDLRFAGQAVLRGRRASR
jgi:hypothetical protein